MSVRDITLDQLLALGLLRPRRLGKDGRRILRLPRQPPPPPSLPMCWSGETARDLVVLVMHFDARRRRRLLCYCKRGNGWVGPSPPEGGVGTPGVGARALVRARGQFKKMRRRGS